MQHVVVRKSNGKGFFVFVSALIVLANASYLFLVKSVMVMPTFGVQLETHYLSGRIVRCFVPVGKILKPLLPECVSPITCYWSLSLLLHGEAELMLVFKELRPMLIPIWRALCDASGIKGGSDTLKDVS